VAGCVNARNDIFKDEVLKYFHILLLACISNLAVASSCISDLNSLDIFQTSHSGNAINYPFSSSRLIDGPDEPELETNILIQSDQPFIIKRSNLLYNRSINSNSNESIRVIDNNAIILFKGPNSGWHITWGFIKINNCWCLNSLKDQST
jgi:hypothetical protein